METFYLEGCLEMIGCARLQQIFLQELSDDEEPAVEFVTFLFLCGPAPDTTVINPPN